MRSIQEFEKESASPGRTAPRCPAPFPPRPAPPSPASPCPTRLARPRPTTPAVPGSASPPPVECPGLWFQRFLKLWPHSETAQVSVLSSRNFHENAGSVLLPGSSYSRRHPPDRVKRGYPGYSYAAPSTAIQERIPWTFLCGSLHSGSTNSGSPHTARSQNLYTQQLRF